MTSTETTQQPQPSGQNPGQEPGPDPATGATEPPPRPGQPAAGAEPPELSEDTADADVDDPETADQESGDPGDTGDARAARLQREAAKHRREARAAQARAETLATQVEQLQRAEAERLAGAANVKPAALWATTALPDLLDENGSIDPDRVTAASKAAVENLGLEKPRVGFALFSGQHPGAADTGGTSGRFLDALDDQRRR